MVETVSKKVTAIDHRLGEVEKLREADSSNAQTPIKVPSVIRVSYKVLSCQLLDSTFFSVGS